MEEAKKFGDFYEFNWKCNGFQNSQTFHLKDWNAKFSIKISSNEYRDIVKVKAYDPLDMEYCVYVEADGKHFDFLTQKHSEFEFHDPQVENIKLRFMYAVPRAVGSLYQDFQKYAATNSNVTLIGSDGEVKINKELLKIRSQVFSAMIVHNSKEKQNSRIDMTQFNKTLLEAFLNFMLTDEIKVDDDDFMNDVINLYILGDKYDIQLLKSRSKDMMMQKMNKENAWDVFDVLLKVDEEYVQKSWIEKHLEKN